MKPFKARSIVTGLALSAGLLAGAVSLHGVTAAPPAATKKAAKQVVYTCPMHPEVVSLKPGQCSKCKMKLTKKTVNAVYTCSHHPKVLSLKPGKCPICKMALKKK